MTGGLATNDRFHALLDRLESTELDATVNLASSLATALRIVSSHPAVVALVRACEEDPLLVAAAQARLGDLCTRAIDARYVSAYDSAIFALLFVLDRCEPFVTAKAAETALGACNTYWAARFASELLEDLIRGAALQVVEETLRVLRPEVPLAILQRFSTPTPPVQEVKFHE